jgi:hypothetical protein
MLHQLVKLKPNPSKAQQKPVKASKAEQSPAKPSKALQSPAKPNKVQQGPPKPSKAQQSPAKARTDQQRPAKPSKAQQSPAKPNQAQQSPAKPSKAQQSPAKPSKAQHAAPNPAIARKRRAEKRPWTAQNQAKIEPKSVEISAKGPPEAPTAPRIAKVAVLERIVALWDSFWEAFGLQNPLKVIEKSTLKNNSFSEAFFHQF